MVELSQDQLEIIRENHLKDGIKIFCNAFTSKHGKAESANINETLDGLTSQPSITGQFTA